MDYENKKGTHNACAIPHFTTMLVRIMSSVYGTPAADVAWTYFRPLYKHTRTHTAPRLRHDRITGHSVRIHSRTYTRAHTHAARAYTDKHTHTHITSRTVRARHTAVRRPPPRRKIVSLKQTHDTRHRS